MKWTPASLALAALSLTWALPADAQVADHLKCYKVKDTLKLAGTVDLDTPQFGLDAGCAVSKATLFCVPATKTNVAVTDKSTGTPITPLAVSGPDPGDRICYKVKCQKPGTAIPEQSVTDQFGNRTMSKFKATLLCTPAFKGATTNTTLPPCAFPASGQTTAYTADKNDGIAGPVAVPDDGMVEAGASLSYVDNGDGTITDNNTGLTWEKKDLNTFAIGVSHHVNVRYVWSGTGSEETIWDWLDTLNNRCRSDTTRDCSVNGDTDCASVGGPCGFTGHRDWRIPNPKELLSIIDYERNDPAVDPIFHTGCVSGCTLINCSCTATGISRIYWTSTTPSFDSSRAFGVADGTVLTFPKTADYYVRAVRGGP